LGQISIPYLMNEGIKPVHRQIPYIDLLFDDSIHVLSVDGPAGSGKTYFAMLAGLMQVAANKYSRIQYMRPNVLADEGHGFLKGSLEDKIAPFNKPAISSLRKLFMYDYADFAGQHKIDYFIHSMPEKRLIEYVPLSWEGGNTWERTFTIADETQFTDHELMKLIVGRVGEGSKLLLLGDFTQMTQKGRQYNYLNARNCGLAHAIDRLAGDPIYAHIQLTDMEVKRSLAAALAAKL
jgi:predicted ribonuclease YlaK